MVSLHFLAVSWSYNLSSYQCHKNRSVEDDFWDVFLKEVGRASLISGLFPAGWSVSIWLQLEQVSSWQHYVEDGCASILHFLLQIDSPSFSTLFGALGGWSAWATLTGSFALRFPIRFRQWETKPVDWRKNREWAQAIICYWLPPTYVMVF